MCGIFAQIRRSASLEPPDLSHVGDLLQEVVEQLAEANGNGNSELASSSQLERAIQAAQTADSLLAGLAGLTALAKDDATAAELSQQLSLAESQLAALGLEELGALPDLLWSLRHDRLNTATQALQLLDSATPASDRTEFQLGAALSTQTALAALNRLEVRGRDSAGLSLVLPQLQLDQLPSGLASRQSISHFRHRNVQVSPSPDSNGQLATVCFTYKVAATIGALGDNSEFLRQAIAQDGDLHACLAVLTQHAVVLAHTRWASVGEISEANAHPLDSAAGSGAPAAQPQVIAAVNGDIDNYRELVSRHGLEAPAEITTDSKIVPQLIAQATHDAACLTDGFATAVEAFQGSAAVAACSLEQPDRVMLSVHGSGQGLYVGLADDSFVVASEPYGILEQTSQYLRLGAGQDTPAHAIGATEAVMLLADQAGDPSGIVRLKPAPSVGPSSSQDSSQGSSQGSSQERRQGSSSSKGQVNGVGSREIVTAEITTRDVTRGDYDHYLLKEISQAPASIGKTLQSQISRPAELAELLHSGRIAKLVAIGQGTAAIAAKAFTEICSDEINALRASLTAADTAKLGSASPTLPDVSSMAASELSGFAMTPDMSDHLIVAISQSGTTTDTNRTVDLLQARGAAVVAIVNRRNSDLSHKANHVLYTSDGRDIEMSVASTKAFYSQITASSQLAFQLVDQLAAGSLADDVLAAWQQRRQQKLAELKALPEVLAELLHKRAEIARIAQAVTTQHRDLAVVGSGRDQIAAQEVRIKLSELCYKSVSVDSIEDKKHIDLSAEPLIVVCAAGIEGSNIDDVFKEIAIYGAHQACPVVFVAEGVELAAPPGAHIISLPVASPELGFVSSAMAGHLFAYEAALAIDALANPLRATKLAIEQASASLQAMAAAAAKHDSLSDTQPEDSAAVLEQVAQHWQDLQEPIAEQGRSYAANLAEQRYDGYLGAGLAAELSSLYRYAGGLTDLSNFQQEFGSVGTPEEVWRRFLEALTDGIEALTRPIDAIRHQAKTVTVGITRTDEAVASSPLVAEVLAAGATRNTLSYDTLRELTSLAQIVAAVLGHTRYLVQADTLSIASRSGISEKIKSQVDTNTALLGIKHQVVAEQRVFLTTGLRDDRTIILVPEVLAANAVAITLLHVKLHEHLPSEVVVAALKGYRNRYEELWGAVTETEQSFDASQLERMLVRDLFTEPIVTLAQRWRS